MKIFCISFLSSQLDFGQQCVFINLGRLNEHQARSDRGCRGAATPQLLERVKIQVKICHYIVKSDKF